MEKEQIHILYSTYLKQTTFQQNHSILAVFSSGECFIIPLESDHNCYKYPNYAQISSCLSQAIKSSKSQRILSKYYNKSHTAKTFFSNPICIGTVKFIMPISKTKVEYISEKEQLIIIGILYKQIPSVGIYQITMNSMNLVFVESLFSVSDITYSSYMHYFVSIPRNSNSSVLLFKPPQGSTIYSNYEHRLIPKLLFAGSHMKRTTHISTGNDHRWHSVSWSDDICPTIITWNFSLPTDDDIFIWNSIVYDFLSPCYIHHVSFDPTSEKIGFILEKDDKTFFCLWNIENNKVIQHNFEVASVTPIKDARWVRSAICSQMVYSVFTNECYYEHHLSEIKIWEAPDYNLLNMCCDESGDRFYFDKKNNLKFIAGSDFYDNVMMETADAKKSAPFPIVKNQMNGMCDNLTGLHLYRCANCRKPLMYPLISWDHVTRLKNCYCSHKCQMNHWPTFVTVHQPLNFDFDFDFEELDEY